MNNSNPDELEGGRLENMEKFARDPDINGIKKMLKIIKDFDSEHEDSSYSDKSVKRNSSNILVISKLNPDAEEFTTRKFKSSSERNKTNKSPSVNSNKIDFSSISLKDSSKTLQTCPNASVIDNLEDFSTRQFKSSFCKCNKIDESPSVNSNNIDISLNDCSKASNKIDVETPVINHKERDDKTQSGPKNISELKDIIVNASKSDNHVHKFQRNVAIATLMKLYANEASTENSQPKLLSPQYFITTNHNSENLNASPEISGNSESEEVVSTKLEDDETDRIRHSIAKVTEWLEMPKDIYDGNKIKTEPDRMKSPLTPVMGPITFKKKTIASSKSSSPLPVLNNASTPPLKMKNFVPSKYAQDLMKKYQENKKTNKCHVSDIWTTLENELIERDEKIIESLRKSQNSQ